MGNDEKQDFTGSNDEEDANSVEDVIGDGSDIPPGKTTNQKDEDEQETDAIEVRKRKSSGDGVAAYDEDDDDEEEEDEEDNEEDYEDDEEDDEDYGSQQCSYEDVVKTDTIEARKKESSDNHGDDSSTEDAEHCDEGDK